MDTATTTLQAGIEITKGLIQMLESGLKVAQVKAGHSNGESS
jgi:hypothetical protein